ncbi:MAG: TolC family protein [Sphingopyxis sp.]|uniref:TolC family protein n=1 Tax=Sphingopyxis sp. TaxID=1908224 RepID=UPI002ABB90C8|nr:TolC family protein [Sphingopyxis sp.]MDZ3831615.1 TolC family protein [Sphingopyxis sp.]
MKILLAAVLAAPLCAVAAQAQSASPVATGDLLTLEEALAVAARRSPANEAAETGVWAAEAWRRVAALRPNPSITIDTENMFGTGPYRGFDESETTVAVAFPVERGGKRAARIASADARTRRASVDAAVARADLRLEVARAYIGAIAADHRAAIAESQLAVTEESLRVARDRVLVGANSPIDEQRAMLEKLRAESDAASARRTVQAARDMLRQYVGDAAPGRLDIAWFDRMPEAHQGPVVPVDVTGSLALEAAAADTALAEAALRLARSERVPDISLTAGTRRLEATNDQAMVIGLSIPLPIFNGGKATMTAARMERDRAQALWRAARFEAERAIAEAEADRDRARMAVLAAAPALAAATEAARIARVGYAEGKFDQMVLLDAERTLLEARGAGIDARVKFHDAAALLERLTTRLNGDGGYIQ